MWPLSRDRARSSDRLRALEFIISLNPRSWFIGAVRRGPLGSNAMGMLGVGGNVAGSALRGSASLSRVDFVRPRRLKDLDLGFFGTANPALSTSPADESESSERDENGRLGAWKPGSVKNVSMGG